MTRAFSAAIACVGELLWDHLPSGRALGGAPANVAYHLVRLGFRPMLVTRVGRDEPGALACAEIAARGVALDAVQIDSVLPTGAAHVMLDERGAASYRFETPAAFDAIELLDRPFEVVVYGTLAQRDERAARTIRALAGAARLALYDVNLRPSFSSIDAVRASLPLADIVKVNDEEARVLSAELGLPVAERELAEALAERYDLAAVAVTRGARGAAISSSGDWHEVPGIATPAVDTVGAGDAFTAALLAGWLDGCTPALCLARANRLGAYVAGHRGAMPEYDLRSVALD